MDVKRMASEKQGIGIDDWRCIVFTGTKDAKLIS